MSFESESEALAAAEVAQQIMGEPWVIDVWNNLGWCAAVRLPSRDTNTHARASISIRPPSAINKKFSYSCLIHGSRNVGNASWSTSGHIFDCPKEAYDVEKKSFFAHLSRVEEIGEELV